MNGIRLRSVYTDDGELDNKAINPLYRLLGERRPWQNISHSKMPSLDEHIKFLAGKPYQQWYLIQDWALDKYKPISVGSIYLTQNHEIGIFLFHVFQHQGYGKIALDMIMKSNQQIHKFLANIAPNNSPSLAFFCNQGFKYMTEEWKDGKLIQYTFSKINPYFKQPV